MPCNADASPPHCAQRPVCLERYGEVLDIVRPLTVISFNLNGGQPLAAKFIKMPVPDHGYEVGCKKQAATLPSLQKMEDSQICPSLHRSRRSRTFRSLPPKPILPAS